LRNPEISLIRLNCLYIKRFARIGADAAEKAVQQGALRPRHASENPFRRSCFLIAAII